MSNPRIRIDKSLLEEIERRFPVEHFDNRQKVEICLKKYLDSSKKIGKSKGFDDLFKF